MSYHGRAGSNANSAVIVTVSPKDFGNYHPLAGVEFQRRLEALAYREGQGRIPVQCFGDFRRNVPTTELGEILPQIKGEYRLANVRRIFPEELADSLQRGDLRHGSEDSRICKGGYGTVRRGEPDFVAGADGPGR